MLSQLPILLRCIVLPLQIIMLCQQIIDTQSTCAGTYDVSCTRTSNNDNRISGMNSFPLFVRWGGDTSKREEGCKGEFIGNPSIDRYRSSLASNDCRCRRRRRWRLSSFASLGIGREFVFAEYPRGGADFFEPEMCRDNDDDNSNNNDKEEQKFFKRMERYSTDSDTGGYYFSRGGRPPLHSSSSSYFPSAKTNRQRQANRMICSFQNWWMEKIDPNIPKVVCIFEPSMTLKLRKTFRPLKTIIRFGADYNTQRGVWQFKSSWEDAIIGGKLTLSGNRELQLTKSWQLSLGAVEDLVTRLRFRAAINLKTFQGNVRVGFRTERLTPFDVVEGFSVLKRLPLDGKGGNLKLEVKACVSLPPEPEIEYRTESPRSLIGMGNVEVSIDEMNLLLDY